jgi:hypothetical protein
VTLNPLFDFVVPFEEDDKDPRIWFLDHNYHESMFSMFKRINGMLYRNSQSVLGPLGAIDSVPNEHELFVVQPRSMLLAGTALAQN